MTHLAYQMYNNRLIFGRRWFGSGWSVCVPLKGLYVAYCLTRAYPLIPVKIWWGSHQVGHYTVLEPNTDPSLSFYDGFPVIGCVAL